MSLKMLEVELENSREREMEDILGGIAKALKRI